MRLAFMRIERFAEQLLDQRRFARAAIADKERLGLVQWPLLFIGVEPGQHRRFPLLNDFQRRAFQRVAIKANYFQPFDQCARQNANLAKISIKRLKLRKRGERRQIAD